MASKHKKIDPRVVQMIAGDIQAAITDDVIDQASNIATTNFHGKGNREVTAILFVLLTTHLRQIPIELREEAGVAFTGLLKHHIMAEDDN